MNSVKLYQLKVFLEFHVIPRIMAAQRRLSQLSHGEEVIKRGGAFGDAYNDTELRADAHLGAFLGEAMLNNLLVGHVTVEGGMDQSNGRKGYWVVIDPLDGSLNYLRRGKVGGFPYTACVTILSKKQGATFNDILGACIIDLRTGDLWVSSIQKHGGFETSVNGERAEPHLIEQVDLGKSVIIAEMYYVDNREIVALAFHDQKGWLRNPGSAAYEMASVSSGQAVAFICRTQKQHEVGAGYALVKGAGGVALDWDGNDLGSQPFTFKTQTPVILATTASLGTEIVGRLRQALAVYTD